MKEISLFNILGPVIIGPSSSHTAGAVRLGNIAAMIYQEKYKERIFICMEVLLKPIEAMGQILH